MIHIDHTPFLPLGKDFTISQAAHAAHWQGSLAALARMLSGAGYTARATRGGKRLWSPPPAAVTCSCRCHTGTCGENDMVLAERTIRLLQNLRPMSSDMIVALDDIVQRAGVDYARAAIGVPGTPPLDDDVPF